MTNNIRDTTTMGEDSVPQITSSKLAIMMGFHKIVPVTEAVIVVNRYGKREYSSREYNLVEVTPPKIDPETNRIIAPGEYKKVPRKQNPEYPSYGKFTRIHKLPLANLNISVEGIKLNDSKMAEFLCDVTLFVRIGNPMRAAERTNMSQEKDMYEGRRDANGNIDVSSTQLARDFIAILEAVLRTTATQQTILEIFQDRQKLQQSVAKQVIDVFPAWGLELTNLEIKHIRDVQGSTIIHDIERKIAAEINADAEVKVATEDKRARVAKAEMDRDAKLAEYSAQETAGKREKEKEQVLGIAEQQKQKEIQLKTLDTNAQTVEAKRKLNVGNAEIEKQVTITNAEAQKQQTILNAEAAKEQTIRQAEAAKSAAVLAAEAARQRAELEGAGQKARETSIGEGEGAKARAIGEGEASATRVRGEAEGAAIKARKVGDAEGTERLAVAQQKYGEAAGQQALEAKKIDVAKDVAIAYANAAAEFGKNATVNVVTGDSKDILSGGIFGKLGFGAKEGAALAQMAQTLGTTPEELAKGIASVLPTGLLRGQQQTTEPTTPERKKSMATA